MLAVSSELDIGDWVSARANAAESVEIAAHTGQDAIMPFGQVSLARVDAAQGHADQAREVAAKAAETAAALGIDCI